jgi:hypothetical protein
LAVGGDVDSPLAAGKGGGRLYNVRALKGSELMTYSTRIYAMLAAAATAVHAAPALAGNLFVDASTINLPGPGVLGLIAAGIVGAVAIARLRK